MKFQQKIDSNGKIYLPRLLRKQGFDKEVMIAPNTRCFLVYPPGVPVPQLLASLDLIRTDLEQTAKFEQGAVAKK